uniref:FXYD domain-containing ion transport regulator n=1 Tax=Oncorhynchus tshawytscha TaxID=74940 RepID=A0AAZ3PCS2_ONCTS
MPDISWFSPYTHLHLGLTRVGVEEEDPFTFDYHRLRVGGLILAAVLCLIGITILFSGHCRCKFNQDKRRRSGSNAAQPLNDQARASEC